MSGQSVLQKGVIFKVIRVSQFSQAAQLRKAVNRRLMIRVGDHIE